MKISSALTFLSLGAASAFGLKPSSHIGNPVASKAAFGGKAMVQPIGIDGQRLGSNDFVSPVGSPLSIHSVNGDVFHQ